MDQPDFFTFLHMSLQEFLAAYHISEMDERSQIEAVKCVYHQNPLSPVLTFYAGLSNLESRSVGKILFDSEVLQDGCL